MASNRDPRPSYRRRNRAKPTSSSTRSKRVKASTAPKPTSSSTRSTTKGRAKNRVTSASDRIKKNPVSNKPRGAQGPRTAPVQGPRQRVSGIIGTRQGSTSPANNRVPTPGTRLGRFKNSKVNTSGLSTPKQIIKARRAGSGKGSSGIKSTLAAGLVTALAAGSLRNPVSKAKSKAAKAKASKSVGKYNTRDADGTVRSRKRVGPKKVGPKKVGPKKVGTISQAFDKAYAAAKKEGKKEFTFKGKRYNTK